MLVFLHTTVHTFFSQAAEKLPRATKPGTRCEMLPTRIWIHSSLYPKQRKHVSKSMLMCTATHISLCPNPCQYGPKSLYICTQIHINMNQFQCKYVPASTYIFTPSHVNLYSNPCTFVPKSKYICTVPKSVRIRIRLHVDMCIQAHVNLYPNLCKYAPKPMEICTQTNVYIYQLTK